MQVSQLLDSSIVRLKERYKYIGMFAGMFAIMFILYRHLAVHVAWSLLLVLCVIGVVLIYCLPKKIELAVLVGVLVTGTMATVITPVLDAPDEVGHLARSMYVAEGEINLTNDKNQLKISDDFQWLNGHIRANVTQSGNIVAHTDAKTAVPDILVTNAYWFMSYLPSAIGQVVGRVLGMDVLAIYYLGRLFNLLCYAFLAYLAVKLSGQFKQLMAFSTLIPMNIYLAASYNQDAIFTGVVLLTVGVFFHLLTKDVVHVKDLFVYSLLCASMSVLKLPYVLLIFLMFLISNKKVKSQHAWLVKLALFILVIATTLLWFKLYREITGLTLRSNVDLVAQLQSIRTHFNLYIGVILNEVVNSIDKLKMTTLFGWLSYDMSTIFLIQLFFAGLLTSANGHVGKLKKRINLGILTVIFMIITTIVLVLYLTWTPIGLTVVEGVQGRYFIGLIPLVLVVLANLLAKPDNKQSQFSDLFVSQSSLLFVFCMLILTIFKYY